MTARLVIIGAGEFGREVVTWVDQAITQGLDWTIGGFLDDRPDALGKLGGQFAILGSLESYQIGNDDLFLCAIGTPATKKAIFEQVSAKGGRFATFIHPSALVGRTVTIGAGSILCPFTQLSCDISIGRLVTFGTFSNSAHDTVIGDWAQISGSCEINGRAVIEEGAYLGSHCTILPNARVGANAYVGAGSVVLRRVAPGIKVFGNPAVPIGPASGVR